jgi:ferredoxin
VNRCTPDTPVRVTIDPAICIGSGNCVRLAPGAIAIGEDGIAQVADLGAQEITRLRLAERSCPTGAILIEEE